MSGMNVDIREGDTLRLFYNEGNPNNSLRHVRAVVDEDYVVTKEWWPTKQRWHYRVEHVMLYEMAAERGSLTMERR